MVRQLHMVSASDGTQVLFLAIDIDNTPHLARWEPMYWLQQNWAYFLDLDCIAFPTEYLQRTNIATVKAGATSGSAAAEEGGGKTGWQGGGKQYWEEFGKYYECARQNLVNDLTQFLNEDRGSPTLPAAAASSRRPRAIENLCLQAQRAYDCQLEQPCSFANSAGWVPRSSGGTVAFESSSRLAVSQVNADQAMQHPKADRSDILVPRSEVVSAAAEEAPSQQIDGGNPMVRILKTLHDLQHQFPDKEGSPQPPQEQAGVPLVAVVGSGVSFLQVGEQDHGTRTEAVPPRAAAETEQEQDERNAAFLEQIQQERRQQKMRARHRRRDFRKFLSRTNGRGGRTMQRNRRTSTGVPPMSFVESHNAQQKPSVRFMECSGHGKTKLKGLCQFPGTPFNGRYPNLLLSNQERFLTQRNVETRERRGSDRPEDEITSAAARTRRFHARVLASAGGRGDAENVNAGRFDRSCSFLDGNILSGDAGCIGVGLRVTLDRRAQVRSARGFDSLFAPGEEVGVGKPRSSSSYYRSFAKVALFFGCGWEKEVDNFYVPPRVIEYFVTNSESRVGPLNEAVRAGSVLVSPLPKFLHSGFRERPDGK